MANAVSTILVRILGDAKGLTGALAASDTSLKGTAVKLGAGLVALGAVKKGFDALGDATVEADRLGDATSRLELQLGNLAEPLESVAGDFVKLGLSRQDVLELGANFADLATKAGIADPLIASTADDVAAVAAAASLLGDQDPETIVDLIGKAAGGATKPLGELGVSMSEAEVEARALRDTGKTSADALTDNELAAARLEIILEQLRPKLDEVAGSTGDVEGKQRELQARVETLSASIGEKLAPAQEAVLGFLNDEIDAIPHAIDGFGLLGDAIGRFADQSFLGLAKVSDILGTIVGALPGVNSLVGAGQIAGDRSESNTVRSQQDFDERNGNSRSALNTRVGGP